MSGEEGIARARRDHADRPRLLRGSSPAAPICRARVKLADGRVVTCKRAFADKQEVCVCGAKRPPETEEDHGYTTVPAKAMKGEGEAVSARVQEQYSREGNERHTLGREVEWSDRRERLLEVIREIRCHPMTREAASTLRGVERQIDALDRKMRAAA